MEASQIRLGAPVNIDRQYIGDIENGYVNVTLETIEKISVALQIPIEDLMKDVGSVKNSRPFKK